MKLLAAILVLMSFSINSTLVHASGSEESIAKVRAAEQARKESDARHAAEQAEQRRKTAAMEKEQNAQAAAAVRPMFGAAAVGKSDEEVLRMYEEKVAREDAKGEPDVDVMRKNSDALTHGITGKSIDDINNMSDADLDKLEAETLKKYGQ